MSKRLDRIYAKQRITKPARKAAKDLLQFCDYIERHQMDYAIYNINQVIKRLEKISTEIKLEI